MVSRIAVFCGSDLPVSGALCDAAHSLGQELVKRGFSLVCGGPASGLMHHVIHSALDAGGNVERVVTPSCLAGDQERNRHPLEVHVPTDGFFSLKERLLKRAEGFMALPGGWGTLGEISDLICLNRQDRPRPFVLLNVEGYWDPFLELVAHMLHEGFGRQTDRTLFHVVSSFQEGVAWVGERVALS